jgi:hypothetical protein
MNQILEWQIESWSSNGIPDSAWLQILLTALNSNSVAELSQFWPSLLVNLLIQTFPACQSVVGGSL